MKTKHDSVPLQREDRYGKMRLMAVAEGYVMARRKGRKPFVVTIDEWVEIEKVPAIESRRDESRAIGGRARAAALTPERRSEIAKLAANARWQK